MCPLTHDRNNYFDRGYYKGEEGGKEQSRGRMERRKGVKKADMP